MAYEPYADAAYYSSTDGYGGSTVPEEKLYRALKDASRHIDTLTFNRIVGQGFENLTEFQQEIIREAVCRQADFEYENRDEIESILSGYSINGVSMTIQPGWNLFADQGIAMQKATYSFLEQTGLCCRLAR